MRRGEIYRVRKPPADDPKKFRFFVIVSRQVLIDSRHSSVICAPIYSNYRVSVSEVLVGVDEGLKHDSSIHCDKLMSLQKSSLTNFVSTLSPQKMIELDDALQAALDLFE
jgi:mRNA interferase MazF